MRAGDFDKRVAIERAVTVPDGQGGDSVTKWVPVQRTWANIQPISARERSFLGASYATCTHRVRLRFNKHLSPASRFDYMGRKLHVQGVTDRNEDGREQTAFCEEKV